MSDSIDPLEVLWDDLLSRQGDKIREAFNKLGEQERKAIIAHLGRMVEEPGWHAEQRLSALVALEALTDLQ